MNNKQVILRILLIQCSETKIANLTNLLAMYVFVHQLSLCRVFLYTLQQFLVLYRSPQTLCNFELCYFQFYNTCACTLVQNAAETKQQLEECQRHLASKDNELLTAHKKFEEMRSRMLWLEETLAEERGKKVEKETELSSMQRL